MKKILFASVMALSLLSCKENRTENAPIVENAVDNAKSSISGSLKSGRYENQIDQIYSEIIKNDKNLKALDDKVQKAGQETQKVLQNYNKVLSISESYYREAEYQMKSITDSLIKKQVETAVKTSAERYNLKTGNIKVLIVQINKNNETLGNLYTAFKIRKTLSEIEKFQNAHPLKTDSLESFIKRQNKLMEELKNIK
ncbi:hypothetical protein [Chryseobacterium sp. SIMBA_028]|uniref:hypothetical protein n=1 Tax=Chryseobacterium sp. SIMBA_028 TaxID=3085771 RepID=UPI0039791E7E